MQEILILPILDVGAGTGLVGECLYKTGNNKNNWNRHIFRNVRTGKIEKDVILP